MRFILIDRILSIEEGKGGTFFKNVTQSEDYFADHFPGTPIMPGVLILECFDQAAQLLISKGHGFTLYPELRSVQRSAFKHYVMPGDQLQVALEIARETGREALIQARAQTNNRTMTEAALGFELVQSNAGAAAEERCRRLRFLYDQLSSDPLGRAWESLVKHL